MCRWIAYKGLPVTLESVIYVPRHSLVHQSLHAAECASHTNGDGFGVGWYGEQGEPGLYREVLPAWSDENLRHIARHIRSPFFFAHVRASTGTPTSRVNCHPFAHERWLFMHNGQVGAYNELRRKIESMIPDKVYASRQGTTDSEAIFLAAFARGLEHDPVAAITATLCEVNAHMRALGTEEPLRFTAALADGRDLFAFRYASDEAPPGAGGPSGQLRRRRRAAKREEKARPPTRLALDPDPTPVRLDQCACDGEPEACALSGRP